MAKHKKSFAEREKKEMQKRCGLKPSAEGKMGRKKKE